MPARGYLGLSSADDVAAFRPPNHRTAARIVSGVIAHARHSQRDQLPVTNAQGWS